MKNQPAATVTAMVIDYMEMFYNSQRLHTTLGYRSPNAFEALGQGGSSRDERSEEG